MDKWWENSDDMDSKDYEELLFGKSEDFAMDPEEIYIEVSDIDFSSIDGKNRKDKLKKITKQTSRAKLVPKKPIAKKKAPTNRQAPPGWKPVGLNKKGITKVSLPSDKEILVQGVNSFILSQDDKSQALKNIGYYKGEKLKELVLIINNDTPNPFTIELFNPSSPLDWLFSTSLNLNNSISVAGNNKVSYTDMLFNLLANPTIIPNAKFVVEGANPFIQENQAMIFKNKNIAGHEKVMPIQMALNLDIDQQQRQILYWDIQQQLGRVFCPDGMEVIEYTILPGYIVTFGFYYKQVSLKKFFWKELRNKGIL